MPRNPMKKSERLAQLEARIRQYEAATTAMSQAAIFKPVLPRCGGAHKWDWSCSECGHLQYAGRLTCHRYHCDGGRRDGATIVGSVRGQFGGAQVEAAVRAQIVATSIPSNYASAVSTHRAGWQGIRADTLNPLVVLRPSGL